MYFEDQCRNAGSAIRGLRIAKGMSVVDLANIVSDGCYADVIRIESGQMKLPYSLVPLWAEALRVSPGTLARSIVIHYEPELGKILYGFGLYPELGVDQSTSIKKVKAPEPGMKKVAMPRQSWVRFASAQA